MNGGARPLRLDRASWPAPPRILVLAPHPDDFDEAGVTLRHLRPRSGGLSVCVLSSSANGVEDSFCDPPTDERKAAVREEEQRRSCRFFGLDEEDLEFLRLPTGEGGYLVDRESSYDRVRLRFEAIGPGLVVLPHGRDSNPDHRLAYAWWRRLRKGAGKKTTALLFRDPKTESLREDAVMPFGEEAAAWKRELLRCHRSQQERNLRRRGYGLDERILRLNRESAARLGLTEPYAEVFEIESGGAIPDGAGPASGDSGRRSRPG